MEDCGSASVVSELNQETEKLASCSVVSFLNKLSIPNSCISVSFFKAILALTLVCQERRR